MACLLFKHPSCLFHGYLYLLSLALNMIKLSVLNIVISSNRLHILCALELIFSFLPISPPLRRFFAFVYKPIIFLVVMGETLVQKCLKLCSFPPLVLLLVLFSVLHL